MILFRYIAGRFARMLFLVLLAFLVLQTLLDLIEHLRRYGGQGYGFTDLFGLVVLNLPEGLYEIMPLVVLLGSIATMRGLARSSELVVLRATGRSATRALFPLLVVTLVFGMVMVAVGNPLVAGTAGAYDRKLKALSGNAQSTSLDISDEGLWLRQADGEGYAVIRAVQANSDASTLYGVSIWRVDGEGLDHSRIEATQAMILPGQWRLEDVKLWPVGNGINSESEAQELDRMVLPTTLTRERLIEGFGAPTAIPIWEMAAFIEQIEAAGLSARRHALWLQMELARPVFFAALVLIGAAFTLQHARAGHAGLRILGAILCGFFLFYMRNFAQVLGDNGQISTALAAWGPPVAALMIAFGLILMLEDG